MPTLVLDVHPELRFLLPPARRAAPAPTAAVATDTVGHVVQAAGIPLTEVGGLALDGRPVAAADRVRAGRLTVLPVRRPQRVDSDPPRFLLDVHLGGLARRMRILGLDAEYLPGADDPELAERSVATHRVLLTQDRGLLKRAVVTAGALVRGNGTAAQLDDVLDRFAPPLAPWTRCTACGGRLRTVAPADIADRVEAGTLATYRDFGQCERCGRAYWRGAHSPRLERIVEHAEAVVRARAEAGSPAPEAGGAAGAGTTDLGVVP